MAHHIVEERHFVFWSVMCAQKLNFPLDGSIVCNDSFQGPGGVAFDFKEYEFQPTFFTYDNSERSFNRVLDAIKRLGLMERGQYKWYPKHYGPLIIDQIEVSDFVKVDSYQLFQELDNLVENFDDDYFINRDDLPIERQLIKDKIQFSMRLVPFDKTLFFKYNVPIASTNIGSTKVVEHNRFCYFHSLIGYNETKFYLLTLFYE